MRFAKVGAANSRDEVSAVRQSVAQTGSESRERFSLFVLALNDLNKWGLERERAKWIGTRDPRVVVYTGDTKASRFSGTRLRIWAAVEIDEEGNPATLLKIADGYRGDRRQYEDYETEAFERLTGERI